MNRVLITGATGFVGQHCLPLLRERTAEVHAVCCHTQPVPSHGIHWHRLDLLDHHATEELFRTLQPSHLLHTAWFTKPSEFWSSPENLRWLESSMTILQQFQTHGGERAVCTGSCAEYDWSRGYCQESSTPLLPATIYGKCKHASTVPGYLRQLEWIEYRLGKNIFSVRTRRPSRKISRLDHLYITERSVRSLFTGASGP